MPSNLFSLNSSFSWDNIINDIVPYWHEINGLMVKEMINSGLFNPIYINPQIRNRPHKMTQRSKR